MSLSSHSLRHHEEPPPPYAEEDPLRSPLAPAGETVTVAIQEQELIEASSNGLNEPPIYLESLRSNSDDSRLRSLEDLSPAHSDRILSGSSTHLSPRLSEPNPEPVTLVPEASELERIRRSPRSRTNSLSEPQAPTVRVHPPDLPDAEPGPSDPIPLTSELARLVIAQSVSLPAVPLTFRGKQRRDNNRSSLSLSSFHVSTQHSATSDSGAGYRIGARTIAGSLVSAEEIKAHLGLLAAFKRLRQRVESCPDESLPDIAQFLDGPQRWAWFVGLAVERFQRWLQYVRRTELATWTTEDIPPLDVLMVWHSYMLNPIWYAEDCDRLPLLGTLRVLDSRFLPAVILLGDLTQYEPCEERILSWFEQTDTPFDPLHSMQVLLHRSVRCPGCGRSNDIPFLDHDGTGYLQRNFRYICVCSLGITKSALALDKFAGDLVTGYKLSTVQPERSLAGALHTRTEQRDWRRATNTKSSIIGSPGGAFRPQYNMLRTEWKYFIKERYGFSITNIPKDIIARFTRTMNAYTDDRPFSIDLAAAVLRQGTFINAMETLGWTTPGFFDDPDNERLLLHALHRYHAFLDLLSAATNAFYVPTLDIDIVWHTHQLKGGEYLRECKELVGWYVDHDDKVEETYHTRSLDETCKAWQQRFGVPYMHCGCPLPDIPMSSKFSSLTRRLSSAKDPAPQLSPPTHPGAPPATHASEHDAVQVSAKRVHPVTQFQLEQRRKMRVQELRRRRERDGKRVLDGKMDEELYRRGLTHINSSSMPVPGAEAQARVGAGERWAAPCVVSFPGVFGTTGVGTCVTGISGIQNT